MTQKHVKSARWGLCYGLWLLLLWLPSMLFAKDSKELMVLATVRPAALILEEVVESLPVEVSVLLKAGSTPHDYALKPSDIVQLKQAELTVWLGPKSEPYLSKSMRHARRIISWESLPSLNLLPLRSHGLISEVERDHDHSLDLHFWFDIDNATQLADVLVRTLSDLRPEWQSVLKQNRDRFRLHLQQQRDRAKAALEKSGAFFSIHDAHYYLERSLGLQSIGAIISDPEIQPGVKHILFMKQQIQRYQAQCVITDPTISSDVLIKLEGKPPLKRVSIDPLGWDYTGSRFSEWLQLDYQKLTHCLSE